MKVFDRADNVLLLEMSGEICTSLLNMEAEAEFLRREIVLNFMLYVGAFSITKGEIRGGGVCDQSRVFKEMDGSVEVLGC